MKKPNQRRLLIRAVLNGLLIAVVIGSIFGLGIELVKSQIKENACQEILFFQADYLGYLNTETDLNISKTMGDFLRYKLEEEIIE